MSLRKLFGKRLREIRKELGLTQEQFAELIDTEANFISQIETGTKSLSFKRFELLAKALNLDYEEFFKFNNTIGKNTIIPKAIDKELKKLDERSQKYLLKMIVDFIEFNKK